MHLQQWPIVNFHLLIRQIGFKGACCAYVAGRGRDGGEQGAASADKAEQASWESANSSVSRKIDSCSWSQRFKSFALGNSCQICINQKEWWACQEKFDQTKAQVKSSGRYALDSERWGCWLSSSEPIFWHFKFQQLKGKDKWARWKKHAQTDSSVCERTVSCSDSYDGNSRF